MKKLVAVVLLAGAFSLAAQAATFNGAPDNQRDDLGYYYAVTGSLFPNGQTLTSADSSSPNGGSIRWIADDPGMGAPIDTWNRVDWTAASGSASSLAFTFLNGATTVFDNNGIAAATYGNYYNATAQAIPSADAIGLYTAYSMSNNYDMVFAGYFHIPSDTNITQMTAYFTQYSAVPGGVAFQMNSPQIAYRMNIWSDVGGALSPAPTNTGSFAGDAYTTDGTPGTFSIAPTGVSMVYGTDAGSATNPIYSVTFTPSDALTLFPGDYWFSSDATVTNVIPEPVSIIFFCTGVVGVFGFVARDTQCGAKLFRVTESLPRLFAEPFISRWFFDVEILARFSRERQGRDCPPPKEVLCEFPLECWRDMAGSKRAFRDYAAAVADLLAIYWKYRRQPQRLDRRSPISSRPLTSRRVGGK